MRQWSSNPLKSFGGPGHTFGNISPVMRRFEHHSFIVQIDPEVWRQISVIPREAFRSLQDAMKEQAVQLADQPASMVSVTEELRLTLQGYVAVCEVNFRLRVLRLVGIWTVDEASTRRRRNVDETST